MMGRRFIFSLTEAQIDALLKTHQSIEDYLRPKSPLATAFTELDEQRANQTCEWERCSVCGGSGWVEDLQASARILSADSIWPGGQPTDTVPG